MSQRTIFQNFEWYLPENCGLWNQTAANAARLAALGITDVWLPPAYKGHQGCRDVGYGVYDLYDLGEFDQKGSVATKYGTKDEYLNAIDAIHRSGMSAMADIVLNHRMGADETERTTGRKMDKENHLHEILPSKNLKVWTHFTFPGRNGKYSDFEWNTDHFSSVDYNALTGSDKYIFKLHHHLFSTKVSEEKGNFDYLMGADVDFSIPEVVEELGNWGRWYLDFTGVDSLRLDAVKHISYAFFPGWLDMLRRYKNREIFAVGEYWRDSLEELMAYLDHCNRSMSLFDVPLHHQLQRAADAGRDFDLRTIFHNTLVAVDPEHAVTFVDNHDTQIGQPLESWVQGWFRPLAYALILLRQAGTPCVFYGDLYGIPHNNIGPVRELEKLMLARKHYGHGPQRDYFDHPNTIGWTRGGHMAVVMGNSDAGWKDMEMGCPGQVFVDLLGNRKEEITINREGWGRFTCNGGSVSVWVPKT